jgi:hypothetical protein
MFALALTASVCAAHAADPADAVKEKLFRAKKAYDDEVEKFRKAVGESLDKREDTARKAGNKKSLDSVKADRERFDKTGEPPTATPKVLITQIGTARANLDKAYTVEVRDLVKLKDDVAASAVEKEQKQFQIDSAAMVGKSLAGRWTRETEGLTEVWTIQYANGKWEVTGGIWTV